jgi:hypothetical protein
VKEIVLPVVAASMPRTTVVDVRSGRQALYLTGSAPRGGATFDSPGGCGCIDLGHPGTGFVLLTGPVPRGVERVEIRSRDGKVHAARIFANGRQWIWLAHDTRPTHPTALLGRGPTGSIITTRKLLGGIFGP